ncbi:MAG: hypothetical protein NC033_05150 [Clostridiales bacterium]|nr:hypothetical protein [Clostridiales bacterium]
MNSVRVKSYAKINLTLDILGVADGYHMIDSVVASIDLCDVISAKKRKDGLISIAMHGEGSEAIPYENNNAARAAEEFAKRFSTCGADITVWKNIPVGAGMGGSSADVAGVLNAMAKMYGVSDFAAVKQIADSLGSDCGYMLRGGWARVSGRGEKVKPLDSNLKLDIGLLVPKSGVSTAECYRVSDRLPKGGYAGDNAERAVLEGDAAGLCKSLSNGLKAAAVKLNADVGECIDELESFAPLGVNMTGSGSGVYAVFENDQFLRYAQSRYRGKYRFIPTKTVLAAKEEKDG